jgi:hypothetical protein
MPVTTIDEDGAVFYTTGQQVPFYEFLDVIELEHGMTLVEQVCQHGEGEDPVFLDDYLQLYTCDRSLVTIVSFTDTECVFTATHSATGQTLTFHVQCPPITAEEKRIAEAGIPAETSGAPESSNAS